MPKPEAGINYEARVGNVENPNTKLESMPKLE
jgi:hypothetical protein